MVFEDEIMPAKKQLFCSHPHGLSIIFLIFTHIYSGCWFWAFPLFYPLFSQTFLFIDIEPKFQYNEYLRANVLAYLPFSGIYFLLYGTQSVDRDNFLRIMKEGKNIYFVPGGFECATITKYGEDRVYIKQRKGFIKYALQYGYTVHPMYCFGENKVYRGLGFGQKIGHFLNRFSIPAIIPFSFQFMLPYRPKLHPVVGKGIEFPQIDQPSKDDVDKYHEIYVNALVALFNRYKQKFEACEELKLF